MNRLRATVTSLLLACALAAGAAVGAWALHAATGDDRGTEVLADHSTS
ncbi:hypothetical protein [Streptomyces aidingensis]|uniref:Uncharacterized protein n=1 Tax=Streptomyces aidingensis TaxID=910347 RepID=A0A1I1HGU9_9ACTN|nr:hypothetical protein [Streptomyces aidingensis]SFC20340.1 hypothetical protein SAMN05421773_102297 [Streptomyces aidingensis]